MNEKNTITNIENEISELQSSIKDLNEELLKVEQEYEKETKNKYGSFKAPILKEMEKDIQRIKELIDEKDKKLSLKKREKDNYEYNKEREQRLSKLKSKKEEIDTKIAKLNETIDTLTKTLTNISNNELSNNRINELIKTCSSLASKALEEQQKLETKRTQLEGAIKYLSFRSILLEQYKDKNSKYSKMKEEAERENNLYNQYKNDKIEKYLKSEDPQKRLEASKSMNNIRWNVTPINQEYAKAHQDYQDYLRGEMADILGIESNDKIEDENPNSIKYQLDEKEIDEFLDLKQELYRISGRKMNIPKNDINLIIPENTQENKATSPSNNLNNKVSREIPDLEVPNFLGDNKNEEETPKEQSMLRSDNLLHLDEEEDKLKDFDWYDTIYKIDSQHHFDIRKKIDLLNQLSSKENRSKEEEELLEKYENEILNDLFEEVESFTMDEAGAKLLAERVKYMQSIEDKLPILDKLRLEVLKSVSKSYSSIYSEIPIINSEETNNKNNLGQIYYAGSDKEPDDAIYSKGDKLLPSLIDLNEVAKTKKPEEKKTETPEKSKKGILGRIKEKLSKWHGRHEVKETRKSKKNIKEKISNAVARVLLISGLYALSVGIIGLSGKLNKGPNENEIASVLSEDENNTPIVDEESEEDVTYYEQETTVPSVTFVNTGPIETEDYETEVSNSEEKLPNTQPTNTTPTSGATNGEGEFGTVETTRDYATEIASLLGQSVIMNEDAPIYADEFSAYSEISKLTPYYPNSMERAIVGLRFESQEIWLYQNNAADLIRECINRGEKLISVATQLKTFMPQNGTYSIKDLAVDGWRNLYDIKKVGNISIEELKTLLGEKTNSLGGR